MTLESVLRAIYPPQCLACSELTETEFALCGTCWSETSFASGLVCDACGIMLPGEDTGGTVICDECMQVARPWDHGRTAMLYEGKGRRIVLALKHGDRTDLARPVSAWMARVAGPLLRENMLIAPVPLHWARFLRRRYNQAALLADALGARLGLQVCPDLLQRSRFTPSLGGRSRQERFETLDHAITVHPRRAQLVKDRPLLLIDDVMTTGATLAACTEAARAAGAGEVNVLTLARAGKAD